MSLPGSTYYRGTKESDREKPNRQSTAMNPSGRQNKKHRHISKEQTETTQKTKMYTNKFLFQKTVKKEIGLSAFTKHLSTNTL